MLASSPAVECREEFRVSAAKRATGTSLVGEVLPFTSPYLEGWELLGKRWRALPIRQWRSSKGPPPIAADHL